jgi:hypothetical protein
MVRRTILPVRCSRPWRQIISAAALCYGIMSIRVERLLCAAPAGSACRPITRAAAARTNGGHDP